MAESGCFEVKVTHLWSGHLGDAKPTELDAQFDTLYVQPGIKEVNLVVVTPSGVIDRSLSMIDVY